MSTRVLWVDDEPFSLEFAVELAESEGWDITSALSLAEGLELVRDSVFDLVIVDLVLPKDDFQLKRGYVESYAGVEFINAVRDPGRQGRTPPDVLLVVISAVVSPKVVARVVGKLGSDQYYLTKPFRIEVFRDLLNQLSETLKARRGSGVPHTQ